jgi:hypothetical protein
VRTMAAEVFPRAERHLSTSSNDYGAARNSKTVDVRFGSKADIDERLTDVRFAPESRHCWATVGCPLCANSRHRAYSITSSASASRSGGI